jgi:hypothetical protein
MPLGVPRHNAGVALTAPTGLTAAQIAVLPSGVSQLQLAWTNTEPAAQTEIRFSNGTVITSVAAGVASYTVTGLAANTSYGFQVLHAVGPSRSQPSNTASASTQVAFNPPTITSVVALGSKRLSVTWTNAQAGDSIEVFRDGTYVGVLGPGTTNWVDTGIWFGSSHSYFLRHFRNTASGSYDTANSNTGSGAAAAPAWTFFVASGSQGWNWPANVTWTYAECLGAGGGSGHAFGRPSEGGGGQGGSYAAKWLPKGAEATLGLNVGGSGAEAPGAPSYVNQNGAVPVSGPGGNPGASSDTANVAGGGGSGANGSPAGDVYHWGGNGGKGNDSQGSGAGGGAAGPSGDGGAASGVNPGSPGSGWFQNGSAYQAGGAANVASSAPGNGGPAFGGGASGAFKGSIANQGGAPGAQGIITLMWSTNE